MTVFMMWDSEVLTHKCPFFYVALVSFALSCGERRRDDLTRNGMVLDD